MFCQKCGTKLPHGARFCEKCGERVCNEKISYAGAKSNKKNSAIEEANSKETLFVKDENNTATDRKSLSEEITKVSTGSEPNLKKQHTMAAGITVAAITLIIITVSINAARTYVSENIYTPEKFKSNQKETYFKDTYFDRNYYISNSVSIADFMRYQNNNINKPCFFERCVVENIPEDRVYICKYGNNWIIINDKKQSLNARAMIGDFVSVYGVYDGVGMVSLTDGSTRQVPVIHADRFIDNEILPEDTESFLYGVVEAMNNNARGYGSGSEYMSDTYAKLVVGVDYLFDYANKVPSHLWAVEASNTMGFDSTYVGNVDGYSIWIKVKWDENIVQPHESGIVTFADEEKYAVARKPVYAYGSFTYMELGEKLIKLTFQIESFEAYQQ